MDTPPKSVEKQCFGDAVLCIAAFFRARRKTLEPFFLLLLFSFMTYALTDLFSWQNPLYYAGVAASSVLFSMLPTYFSKGMLTGIRAIAIAVFLFVVICWVLKLLGYSPKCVPFAVMTSPDEGAHVDRKISVGGTLGPCACDTRIFTVAVMQLSPPRYYCYRLTCKGDHTWTSRLEIGRVDDDYEASYELSVWVGNEEDVSKAVKPTKEGHSTGEMTHKLQLISDAIHVTRNPKE